MKILRKSIAFLFLAFFAANASLNPLDMESVGREKENVANPSVLDYKKISVYLHPITLLFGANAKMLLLYSTIEIPLSLYNAPIIKPSLWNNEDLLRIGSDFGFRHYLAGKGDGLYLQPQAGLFYFSATNWSGSIVDLDDENGNGKLSEKKRSGAWFDGMLYLGNAYKFTYISIYSDTGIGYGCSLGICSLIWDANIGIGVSF
jgi:hypothetical protein